MKKLLITVAIILAIPAVSIAGFSFGLIKASKKTADKVDTKVANRKAEIAAGVHNTTIVSVSANPTLVAAGAVSAITCTASDPEGDTLTYTWSAASGTITGTGATVNWTAPASSGTYVIGVAVSDGHGGSVSASYPVLYNQKVF